VAKIAVDVATRVATTKKTKFKKRTDVEREMKATDGDDEIASLHVSLRYGEDA
jgi:hypothetical protein